VSHRKREFAKVYCLHQSWPEALPLLRAHQGRGETEPPSVPAGVEARIKSARLDAEEKNLREAYETFTSSLESNVDAKIFAPLLLAVDWEKARMAGKAGVARWNRDLWQFLQAPPSFDSITQADLKDYIEWSGVIPGEGSTTAARQSTRITEVLTRHREALLGYPNVVEVEAGEEVRGGRPTGHQALRVLVGRELPADRLRHGERLPSEIEGIPVDVVERRATNANGAPGPIAAQRQVEAAGDVDAGQTHVSESGKRDVETLKGGGLMNDSLPGAHKPMS
jgi:hypothetical protein